MNWPYNPPNLTLAAYFLQSQIISAPMAPLHSDFTLPIH